MRLMKSILRMGTALFTACLLACACSVTAFAEAIDNADHGSVRLNTTVSPRSSSEGAETLLVHVAISEIATDGMLTLSYDPTVLSLKDEDIEITELAAVYSINNELSSEGILKIGFIVDETLDSGDIAILTFTVLNADADPKLDLTPEVYGEDENLLDEDDSAVYTEEPGNTPKPNPPTTTTTTSNTSTTPAESSKSSESSSGTAVTPGSDKPLQTTASNGADGGDSAPNTGYAGPLAMGIGAAVSLCGIAACTAAYRRKKH